MNIGILVHSHTGNTLSVAEKLEQALLNAGHTARIERITAVNEDPSAANDITLKDIPDIAGYDALLLGAPVRGFSLSPVMGKYLAQIGPLNGRKIGCFVTQKFPKPWMGGNRSVRQMAELCRAKGAAVTKTGVVNWDNKAREAQISSVVEQLSKL